jgi:transcriptional regulator with XRE-family HTH domain
MSRSSKAATTSTTTASHLAQLRSAKGLTQRAVAQALGLSPGNYNEIESGKRNLPAHHITKLAELFAVSPRQIVVGAGSARLEKLLGSLSSTTQDNQADNETMLVYTMRSRNDKGHVMLDNTDACDTMPRPSFLRHVRGAFVMQVMDDQLSPRYEVGEFVIVNPNQTPQPNGDCVVRDYTGAAYIRRYAGSNDDHHLFLEQFTPKRTIRVKKPLIDQIYAVVARLDGRA